MSSDNPIVPFTFGKHQMSKLTETTQTSRWDDLWDLLQEAARTALEPWQKAAWVDGHGNHWATREEAPKDRPVWFEGRSWIAPFLLYPSAVNRKYCSIKKMSNFAGFDIDHGLSETGLREALGGYPALAFSTAHATIAAPRWRVLVLLSRGYRVEDHLPLWFYFNDVFDGHLDVNTKDATRIHGMPAQWRGGSNVMFRLDGDPADVDAIMDEYGGRGYTRLDYEPATELQGAMLDAPIAARINITALAGKHFRNQHPGGRFWRMLLAIARDFHTRGWRLTDQQLCDAALEAAGKYAPEAIRNDPLREARRAIGFINAQPRARTPEEKRQAFQQELMRNWKPTI